MTDAERRAALEAIAAEVRACTKCRLHEGRTKAVPGEGDPDTEVVFVGEGPGFNEDHEGRPFVGRAGGLLVQLLKSIGWSRDQVFITNVVKCRPPENRDPYPDEIAACQPYLQRQLQALDPALVVTLGRHSMGTFLPGARIGQVHGTSQPADPATGARDALVFAMYHPAAALRSPEVERVSFEDVGRIPETLLRARAIRERSSEVLDTTGLAVIATAPASPAPAETAAAEPEPTDAPAPAHPAPADPALVAAGQPWEQPGAERRPTDSQDGPSPTPATSFDDDQLTLF